MEPRYLITLKLVSSQKFFAVPTETVEQMPWIPDVIDRAVVTVQRRSTHAECAAVRSFERIRVATQEQIPAWVWDQYFLALDPA